jgi:hypothetical protein
MAQVMHTHISKCKNNKIKIKKKSRNDLRACHLQNQNMSGGGESWCIPVPLSP